LDRIVVYLDRTEYMSVNHNLGSGMMISFKHTGGKFRSTTYHHHHHHHHHHHQLCRIRLNVLFLNLPSVAGLFIF